jgi:hypothetical protein
VSPADTQTAAFPTEGILRILARLQAALKEAPKAENGREAACLALDAVIEFLNSIEQFEEDGLAGVLLNLRWALSDLERGIVVPLLTPANEASAPGRKPDPIERELFKALVFVCVDHMKNGGLTIEASCRAVARDLKAAGIRIDGNRDTAADWETLQMWRNEVSRLPENDYEMHFLRNGKATVVAAGIVSRKS